MDCCPILTEQETTARKKTLYFVLAINATMFVIEVVAAVHADSVALFADSLDMLGDALVYGLSLWVIGWSHVWQRRMILTKSVLIGAPAVVLLAETISRIAHPTVPIATTISSIGALALAANLFSFVLLLRHRGKDANMRSSWLCSRNDVIANVSVIAAGVLVGVTGSGWPDIVAGFGIAALVLRSSWEVCELAPRVHKEKNNSSCSLFEESYEKK